MNITTKLLLGAALASLTLSVPAHADDSAGIEKCYGIAKSGKNDCASKINNNSCAGQTTRDGQGFLIVAKGTCEKLVGGYLDEAAAAAANTPPAPAPVQ